MKSISTKGMTREQWLTFRKQGIGGSDMGKLLGLCPPAWGNPVSLWLEKTGRAPSFDGNEATWRGTVLEGPVSERYAEKKGVLIREHKYIIIDEINHIGGNVDRLVLPPGMKAVASKGKILTPLGLEAKTTKQAIWDLDEVPEYFKAQVQTYMSLSEALESFDIAALFLGHQDGFEIYHEKRDESVIDFIRCKAREFWERYIIPDTPPPAETEEDCKALWRHSTAVTVVATGSVVDALQEIKSRVAVVKNLNTEIAEFKASIMDEMKEADTLTDENGVKLVTWKKAKDSEKTDWEAVVKEIGANAEIVAKHTKISTGSRRFLTK